jgi:hypothetical protein
MKLSYEIQYTVRVNHISKLLRLSKDMLYYINTNNLDNIWYITGDQNRHWRVTWRYRTPQENGMENTGKVQFGYILVHLGRASKICNIA